RDLCRTVYFTCHNDPTGAGGAGDRPGLPTRRIPTARRGRCVGHRRMKNASRTIVLWGGVWLGLAVPAGVAEGPDGRGDRPEAGATLESKIRPVWAGTCLRCHGGEKVRGGLRLDTRDHLVKGGEHGPAVVPGDPEKSLLIQAVRHAHDEIKMPPDRRLPD